MRTVLICPAERPNVPALAESAPLALVPILGKALIEYWLEHLVTAGAKRALILATDRPEQVRAFVAKGEKWGLRVEVIPEIRELTPTEARAKYRACDQDGWLKEPDDVALLDCLPGLPEQPLFASYAGWFAALQAWMPRAATPDRIGMRELQPGVWVGLHTRVMPGAELRAPCWLGESVYVGPEAVIGPRAILESGVFIEGTSELSGSVVGPETFVGKLTELKNSLAMGRTLVNWKTDSHTKVPGAFLLCALNEPRPRLRPATLVGRLAALGMMLWLLPGALLAVLRAKLRGQPALRPLVAVRPRTSNLRTPGDVLLYYELAGVKGWLRRWPQLWSIACGDFAWVGNRPLSPDQAAQLSNDFERLWLAAPLGLISLADAEASGAAFSDEACAHASFYAAEANWRLDMSILGRALFRFGFGFPFWRVREQFARLLRSSGAEGRQAH
jgi:hypothetical protein